MSCCVRAAKPTNGSSHGSIPMWCAKSHHRWNKVDAMGVIDCLSETCSLFSRVSQTKEFGDPLHRRAGHGDVSFQGESRLTVDGPGDGARQRWRVSRKTGCERHQGRPGSVGGLHRSGSIASMTIHCRVRISDSRENRYAFQPGEDSTGSKG